MGTYPTIYPMSDTVTLCATSPRRTRVADFRVRGIPDDLWRKLKAMAALEEKTINEKLVELIRDAVDKAKWPK